ncbi:NAD(P)-dependent oxidoreductase [Consotaella aegiceratis]|uniref:NAD(P)-dependent oxidoreductase n=1 Tax=Consotaella aegiceratis TaxID=3097961 RepID=UPI002F3EBE15
MRLSDLPLGRPALFHDRRGATQPHESGGASPDAASETLEQRPGRQWAGKPTTQTRSNAIMAKVAFIGLGVMGYPMAGHLKTKGGHDVTVYNRTGAKAEKWASEFGGNHAATPKETADGADFVFCCVGNDDDVRSVILGETGAFAGMKPGAILIDNTTASAELARELDAAARDAGLKFLDAPVSGGQAGAENGALTVMVGGEDDDFAAAKPVIECYAKMVGLMGPAGSGQLTKMMNQICIAGLVQGLSEAIHFGKRSGLDITKVVDVISKGAAGSWQMENRHRTMAAAEYDHGFAVEWMRKDLSICLAEARRNGSSLPVTALVDQFYAEVEAMGGTRWDTSSLLARLER